MRARTVMVYLSRNFLPRREFRHREFGAALRLTLTREKYGHVRLQPLMNQAEHDITGAGVEDGNVEGRKEKAPPFVG